MKKLLWGVAAAAVLAAAPGASPSLADGVKVGFLNGFSGGRGIFGRYQWEGFMLAVEDHLGGKLGGLKPEVIKKDTQHKPDVGRQIVNEFIKKDKVSFIAGITWSNVLAAVWKQPLKAKTFLISTNAGWSGMDGKNCNPYFFRSGWNNDMMPEAMGKLMRDEGIEGVFELSANYQAGKDMLAGFNRQYKKPTKGKILYKLGQSDWQAEISQIRAIKPSSIFAFLPGAMGVSFMKQYKAAGLDKEVKLYTVFTVDFGTLSAHGQNAVGSYHTNFWNHQSDNPANQRFVKDYIKKYGHHPSNFSVQGYDGALLIDLGIRGANGDLKNHDAIRNAMRTAAIKSPRGKFSYNVNHSPIQDYWKREVVNGPDGKPTIVTRGKVFANAKDSHYTKCKMKW